jgi:membrane fusion protein, multidrug efflux system
VSIVNTTLRDHAPAAAPPTTQRTRRRLWPWLVVIGLAGGATWFLFPRVTLGQGKTTTAAPAAGSARPVPVVAVAARTGEMGVFLTGLGTATSLNTVTVRSRVDGQLINVAFKEGQIVHKGDLLAEIDPRPFQVQLTQAEGQAAKDEATLKNTRLDLARDQDLFNKGIIPKQMLDTQISVVDQSSGALRTDQGQIDSARLNLVYSRIEAPISGRVGLRLVDVGNIVHATDQNGLVVITQIDPIAVVFTIAEDSLPDVMQRVGRGLKVDAYDRDLRRKIASGTLLTVDNQIDQTTGTVKLKAEFPNGNMALFPNQLVNARLRLNTIEHAVIVPSAAIQRSPTATFVYVVSADQSVAMRNIEIERAEGDDTAVKSGVAAGDLVVIDGVDKLQQGTRVSVQSAQPTVDGQKAHTP